MEICDRAIERVRTLEDKERYLQLCFKHLICPKCGEDIEKKFAGDMKPIPPFYRYSYECKECNWRDFRSY
jgi:C4-type Zn-finger protein